MPKRKSIIVSLILFLGYAISTHSLGISTDSPIVNFRSVEMPSVNLDSDNISDAINQFHRSTIPAQDNLIVGLIEAGVIEKQTFGEEYHDELLQKLAKLDIHPRPNQKLGFGKHKWNWNNFLWNRDFRFQPFESPILKDFMYRETDTFEKLHLLAQRSQYGEIYFNSLPLSGSFLDKFFASDHYKLRIKFALSQNQLEAAIKDCRTFHRISILALNSTNASVSLSGAGNLRAVGQLWCEILSHSSISEQHLLELAEHFSALPSISGIGVLDIQSRLTCLSTLVFAERFGIEGYGRRFNGTGTPWGSQLISTNTLLAFADWNAFYKRVSRFYDECVDILKIEDDSKRKAAIAAVSPTNRQELLTRNAGVEILFEGFALTAIRHLKALEDAREVTQIIKACIALKHFHLENQHYPRTLEELPNNLSSQIHRDIIAGDIVKFLPLETGAIFYGIGRNKRDDGGWGTNLTNFDDPYDDIVFLLGDDPRIPPKGTYRPFSFSTGRQHTLENARELSFSGEEVNSQDFSNLANFPNLVWLDLGYAQLPEEWPAQIANLGNLQTLSLAGHKFRDGTFKALTNLPNLETLNLSRSSFVGSLTSLRQMDSLRRINFAGVALQEEDLKTISSLKNVEELNLCETTIDDTTIKLISTMPKLKVLHLAGTTITDKGIEALSNAKQLTHINLDFTDITNNGLAVLEGGAIECISVTGTQVDNRIVTRLAYFPRLTCLRINHTRFSINGQGQLSSGLMDQYGKDLGVARLMNLEKGNSTTPDLSEVYETKWGNLRFHPHAEDPDFPKPYEIKATNDNVFKISLKQGTTAISNTRGLKGDFTAQVKVVPDWPSHHRLMQPGLRRGDAKDYGGPHLSAGLLVWEAEGHYLKWCWNSTASYSYQQYSLIQPEYFWYKKTHAGFLNDFELQHRESLVSSIPSMSILSRSPQITDDLMIFPDAPTEAGLDFYDHEEICLRLKRIGNEMISQISFNGEQWETISKKRIWFKENVNVGIWCGKLSAADYEFHFEDFTIKQ